MRLGWAATYALFAAVLFRTAPVAANAAMVRRHSGQVGGPVTMSPTRLVVEHEDLEFDCHEAAGQAECTFTARYHIFNPAAEPEDALGVFYGVYAHDVSITLDGHPVARPLAAPETEAFDRAIQSITSPTGQSTFDDLWRSRWTPESSRHGLALSIAPGVRADLTVTGRISPRPVDDTQAYWTIRPALGRHPVLARYDSSRRYGFDYLLSPVRTWASAGPIQVVVRAPAHWRFRGGAVDARSIRRAAATGLWRTDTRGPRTVHSSEIQASDGRWLQFDLETPRIVIEHGGPFIGLGGRTGPNGGFRMRLGYEFAFFTHFFGSLSVDTDFQRELVLSPVLEAATPFVAIIPSVSIGLGPVFRVLPSSLGGVRIQLSAGFPVLSFVATLDVYPAAAPPLDDVVATTLLARLSL